MSTLQLSLLLVAVTEASGNPTSNPSPGGMISKHDPRCSKDEYYDEDLKMCCPCLDLCLPQRGTKADCLKYCGEYGLLSGMSSTSMDKVDPTTSFSGHSSGNSANSIVVIAVLLTITLSVLIVILVAVYLKRRTSGHVPDMQDQKFDQANDQTNSALLVG